MQDNIRGRFAPSPTGEMHLGNAWTAMLAWLQVRAAGGTMVLRIEDLDPDRSRREYIEALINDMKWLGLDWDEGPDAGGRFAPYCQDDRRHLYAKALNILQNQGLIYPCYCTRAELSAMAPHAGDNHFVYPGTCRNRQEAPRGRRPALRLAVPDDSLIEFNDLVKGNTTQDIKNEVGDFVLRRSDGVHAYQLAVVVDDGLMEITHVVRGDDLLDSTPRQLLLYRLLNLKMPEFGHVPLLYGEDGHRLSKRQRSLSIAALRKNRVKAEAIIGFLAWKAGFIDKQECLPVRELVSLFDLQKLPDNHIVVENDAFMS